MCGVGGVRTLVQTTNTLAFYMLISWLVLDCETDKNTQTPNLASKVSPALRNITPASLMG